MSKVSFVSGSLHRISGQISEAASRMHNPPQEMETASNPDPEAQPAPKAEMESSTAAPVRRDPPRNSAAPHAAFKPRYEELLRMRRDLTGQLQEAEARLSAEYAALESRISEKNRKLAEIRSLLSRLESCRIPEWTDPDFQPAFHEALRTFENGRIELIRATVSVEQPSADSGRNPAPELNLSSLTAGFLFRKGCAFFLPLILALLGGALFLAAAFVLAWKVAL